MTLHQTLQSTLEQWKEISGLDYCLMTLEKKVEISTADKKLPSEKKLQEFLDSSSLTCSYSAVHLFKIHSARVPVYLLVVWGRSIQAQTIGELAVCQIESHLAAYREKTDKTAFMQKLLLGTYNSVEAYTKAKKLYISVQARRAVLLAETKNGKDESVLATVRNLFSAKSKDFITSFDNNTLVIIKELRSTDTEKVLEETALVLVDMLNTEAMTPAWVSYSGIAENLEELQTAYQEARTALEVGKIFNSQKNTFGYNQLGIGRLLYQIPLPICKMFIDEIFQEHDLDSLDEETLRIIETFFKNNLNLSETSRQLYIHRNTLVYRLEKIQKKFNLDIRTFEDALTLKIAMMVADYMKYTKQHPS